MHFEDLLADIGSFGMYQRLLSFLLIPFTTGIVGFTYYVQLFVLAVPPHTCNQRPHEGGDQEFYHHLAPLLNTTPYDSDARQPYTCHQFDLNVTSSYLVSDNVINVTSLEQLPSPTMTCVDGWKYDLDHVFSSYTSENDWVCEEAWRPYMVVTMFWVGNTVGSWLWGFVSDMFGRRPTVGLSLLVYGLAGVASVFVRDFYGFTALRFLVGSSHHIVSHLPFVLVVEYCGLESRVVPLLTIMMTYTTVSIITPALAWVIWDWYTLVLISGIFPLVLLLTYRWIPESSSWLIAQGKSEAARAQLSTVAKVNGHRLPEDKFMQFLADKSNDENEHQTNGTDKGSETSRSIIDAVKYPNLRKNILLVMVVWMLACMCFYGHCQNTANLGRNVFMSYLLGAVVEVPSWCVPWLIHRLGRRLPLTAAFLLSSIAGFIYAVVPEGMEWLALTVALVGRATITGAYYITLQYCPEVFPTVVRGQGVALAETLGGVAIFLSPSIVYLGEWQRGAPLLVFGGLSMVAGFSTLLLPETAGVALPQTLPQAELFFSRSSASCCRFQIPMNDDKTFAEDELAI
ncbi:organic cation transporter protein-like [Homarus americanus]|uniref:organic cation transporter protein-like n=1 Tax=Homarus americanus TaxID=6706 RepID=UPI001C472FE9|nr:organic cation transporter protein-like [Homarus americanus]XP_042216267.1 organic cation transporter protein-like [Homarus americanus]XP_042216268.1 organic cation transporter protein-like [Homarus americanus]XP_042216269.1 organic cation transporter protein-like [Homarus americanus]XP_042216270.1 organic cation transporter protein-like [Homarus americanus]